MPVITPIYTVAASAYVNAEARRYIAKWWWAVAAAPAALAVAGAHDMRFLYLALMLVLVVYPMVLSMMWIVLAGRPSTSMLARPQHLSIDGDGATLFFHAFPKYDEAEGEVIASVRIGAGAMQEAENHGKHFLVYIDMPDMPKVKYLLIPAEYFGSRASATQQ